MCGIFGDVTRPWRIPSLDRAQADGLRDAMAARGPDDAQTFAEDNVLLGHRRLAVRAPGPDGAQPLIGADGRWAIVFNGELYEDRELRELLREKGRGSHPPGDAATVLAMFEAFGIEAVDRFRGMFALAAIDRREQVAYLARDSFGMKPLYWWSDADELVFASSPTALLEHPRVPCHPDLVMVSAYLSTLRTELRGRTLFENVRSVRPGEVLEFRLDDNLTRHRSRTIARPVRPNLHDVDLREAGELLREALRDSVARHLVSDVPVACLLSGGVDSTAICAMAQDHGRFTTYCAGTPGPDGAPKGDLEFARTAADALGLEHRSVAIDGIDFEAGWRHLVQTTGLPLTTPNEIAILDVARAVREDGQVVALSGEGADEILGGYGGIMRAASVFESDPQSPLSGGRLHLEISAWISPAAKSEVVHPDLLPIVGGDEFVVDAYTRAFDEARAETAPDAHPLEAHLRFLRRINLSSLLGRLDKATMAASIEGRTPFADRQLVALVESLPMHAKLEAQTQGASVPPRGKLALRSALEGIVPQAILERPKASFPLPFQGWLETAAKEARESHFARAVFDAKALEFATSDPKENWAFAWPMLNIVRWGDRWWPA